jgi:uncharacterized protein (DUF4415 family)
MSEKVKEYDFTKAEVGKYAQRDPAQSKTRITIYLDDDVLEYFKQRARQTNAAPYQTQINNELRAVMENRQAAEASVAVRTELLTDDSFIRAVATRLQELELAS